MNPAIVLLSRHRAWVLLLAGVVAGPGDSRAGEAAAVRYRFALERDPEVRVRVRLEFPPSGFAESTFEVSREWGGVVAGGEDIAAVRVFDPRGRQLPAERPEPHRWRVRHGRGDTLAVEYDFAANTNQAENSPDLHRRPILNAEQFHAYGYLALLVPGGLDARSDRPVEIEWSGFEAAGWQVACSFGVGPGPHRFTASLDDLRNAVYIAGSLALERRDVEGRPVHVALAGRDWSFTAAQLADLVGTIVAQERRFFADFDIPYFLVTAIPIGQPAEGSRSMGGTGLKHSFSLAMLATTGLEGGHDFGMRGLLAHEMFHTWIGGAIAPEDPEQLVYWFTEGFTDFYTRRMLLRGGLATPEEWASVVDARLAELYTSPAATAPNERIRTDFWTRGAVKRLPYLRGDLVAMLVDAWIHRRSSGARSLDDLMRELLREVRSTGEKYTTEELLRRIDAEGGEALAERIRRIVVDGELPDLAPDDLGDCVLVHHEELPRYELGFDFESSTRTGRVAGVVPGSKAAGAGLRDGQKLVGWSVQHGDATRPVRVTVEDDAGRRELGYAPTGTSVRTPRITLRSASGRAPCSGL
jgi:predicted metalloprotease with PDZ domain